MRFKLPEVQEFSDFAASSINNAICIHLMPANDLGFASICISFI
jgi:hypothetical protein